jgi:hypothetical protein
MHPAWVSKIAQNARGPRRVQSRDAALPLEPPMRGNLPSRQPRAIRVKAAAATVVGAVTALVVAVVANDGAVQALTMPHN